MKMTERSVILYGLLLLFGQSIAFSDLGKWDVFLNRDRCGFSKAKPLFKNSKINVRLTCESHTSGNITVAWTLRETMCWPDSYRIEEDHSTRCNDVPEVSLQLINNTIHQISSTPLVHNCALSDHIILQQAVVENKQSHDHPETTQLRLRDPSENYQTPIFTIAKDGVYIFSLIIKSNSEFNVSAHVEIQSNVGYLSAAYWPLLPFYGIMCAVYTVLCLSWLIVSWMQWRDLLRIQFWIGGVALLGMLESATFYGVYASMNTSGHSLPATVLFAEWVSVAKRALARMLVIIVSLGFGIVKPRLGGTLQRVAGAGILWGVLAALEAWLRHARPSADSANVLLAQAPLALLDSAICWWVFVSLAHTMRTLRLRRNLVKLSLYRHFTNTLIFAVVSSVIFMLYSIKMIRFGNCITDWKELWVEEAYWHVLFAAVLAVIMVLWRPTNNNQRYAFTPLLDNADDDDEEEEQFVSDAYGVKMRGFGGGGGGEGTERGSPGADADLRWVEEHIPAATLPLPVLDSDEEIINAKFEVSKMQ